MNLRKEAKGRECTIRIPGVCNWDNSTSVLCHLNGAGMALKEHDLHAAIGCSKCHDCVDLRNTFNYLTDEIKLMHLEAVIRTQKIWIEEGFI